MSSDLVLKQQLQEQGLLDRFSERAIQWAEQVGVRWIELEGELWTPVFHLEEQKGVGKQDFAKNAVLAKPGSRGCSEKKVTLSEGAQRLLKVPGVRWASIPTAFDVEGGYALSCVSAKRNDDILSIVRSQWHGWPVSCSQFLLANVPLALAYLQHGCSGVAKATRDLTIGTTIDVGKAAAAKENAPVAVQMIAGFKNTEVAAAFQALLLAMASDSERAHSRLDDHDQELAEVKQDIRSLKAGKPKPRSVRVKKADRDLLFAVWEDHYGGLCPRCNHPVRSKDLEVEHWTNREIADLSHVWLVCGPCNTELGEPVGNGGKKRTADDNRAFHTFQDLVRLRRKRDDGIQLLLGGI